ncbi:acyltransferase family protein [Lapillicoccus sp.]|uniref:acyltransferase family protein n=1 Tax=Lapillicoccus sp. TaxID=1909287 RepID=UPI0039832423
MSTLERTVTQGATVSADGGATSRARATSAMSHLDGLDGLRALAIIAVVAYHLDPAWLPGGFLGVDVFFVVSGFLITSLLQREASTRGTIDLTRFWVRRARRLLPALAVCVTVSILVARLVHRDLLVHLPRQVAGALTFSTNWVEIGAGSSYFDQTSPQLFMNFWSLAVEEQFYALWPLAVAGLVASAVALRVRLGLTLAAAAVSTALMAAWFVPGRDATRVYYGTDTHLMGLMLGAALAFAWASPRRAWLGTDAWQRWRRPAIAGSLAILAVLAMTLTEETPLTFRGGIALASVATAVLVAGLLPVGEETSRWRRLMGAPVLGWVGRRSYGIYLWHWPVIVIVGEDIRTAPGTPGHLASRLWCVLVTLALADLSYRFVEAPVRAWGFREVARMIGRGMASPFTKVPRVVAGSVALMLVVTTVLVLTAPDRSETQRLLDDNSAYAGGSPAAPGGGAVLPAPSGPTTAGPTPAAAPPTPVPSTPTPGTTAPAPTRPVPPAGVWTMPTGPQIDGFGDSMMVASVNALEYYFPGMRMDGKSNRRWSDGLAAVSGRGADVRRGVVLAFGTNAGVDEAVLGQVLDALGPDRMVVLVNIYGKASWIDEANAAVARAAATRPNVIVADWNTAIRAQPNLLQSDGIHPGITGAHLFSKTVRAAMAALSERQTGVTVALKDLPAY